MLEVPLQPQARLFGGIYPHRAAANPVTAQWFYMLNCRVNDGFAEQRPAGEQRDLIVKRRTAGATTSYHLRTVHADAVLAPKRRRSATGSSPS